MFGRLLRKVKGKFSGHLKSKIENNEDQKEEEQKTRNGFWHSVCSYMFDDYVKELEDRADQTLERHVKIRLRTAVYLLLIMIGAACISLIYLYIRKQYNL